MKKSKKSNRTSTKQIVPEPTKEDYEHSKYVCTADNVLKMLDQYGVAIIDNVLTEKECTEIVSKVWDYLEHITSEFDKPIDRNDKSTYRSIYELFPLHAMLIQHFGIGHSQFNWDIRQNPKVVDVFSKIWSVKNDELLTSFDGASIGMPFENTNRGKFKSNYWYHVDQRLNDSRFKCIQSWITHLDVRVGDATLTIVEGSHRYHQEFAKRFSKEIPDKDKTGDWYKFTNDQLQFYLKEKGLSRKCVYCPAGSMVLWDSRTVHAGIEAQTWRAQPNFRMVSYVSMLPRKFATTKDLEKKQLAFKEKRVTTHWATPVKLFPKTPRTYGKKLPTVVEVKDPVLTDLGKKLAGF